MKISTVMYRRKGSTYLLFAAVFLFIVLFQGVACRVAMSAEIVITPSVELNEEFNDNIFLSAGSRSSDFITTVSPMFSLSRNTERLKSDLAASSSWYTYARNHDLDSQDYNFQGQASYRLSPRNDIGLSAKYTHYSRPDSIDQATNLATSRGSDINSYSVNAGRVLNLSSSASVNYAYQRQTYDNPLLLGNTTHSAGLGLTKDLGAILPLLKGNLNFSYSRAIYSNATNDDYSLSIGAGRNITEKLTWSLSGGGRYTHSSFDTFKLVNQTTLAVTQGSSDDWGWIGSASLAYTGEKWNGSLSVSHNFSNTSGQVGATESTLIVLGLGRQFTRNLSGQFSGSYTMDKSSNNQFAAAGTDDKIYQLGAGIQYRLSDYFDLGLRYSYYNDKLNSGQVGQNKVFVSITGHGKFRLIGTTTLLNEVSHGTR